MRLELQPKLVERANDTMKAFCQQNYKNYLNVISKLELDSKNGDSIIIIKTKI
ncbi:hypothetical protein [Lysinibacillus tabacifolii]|uniref:hypothetical protein n=1 Tax=Lysinibacillus tabacifolii TaxID=1173107 RepID=UPI00187D1101|nr:hypothetical protein [Lysinibacillus tabacifolii]